MFERLLGDLAGDVLKSATGAAVKTVFGDDKGGSSGAAAGIQKTLQTAALQEQATSTGAVKSGVVKQALERTGFVGTSEHATQRQLTDFERILQNKINTNADGARRFAQQMMEQQKQAQVTKVG